MYNFDPEFNIKVFEEKRNIRKCGNTVGVLMLIIKLIALFVSFIIGTLSLVFVGDTETFQNLIKDDLVFSNITNIIINAFVMFAPFLLFAIYTSKGNSYNLSFSRPKTNNKDTAKYILFAMFLSYVAGLVRLIVSALFSFVIGKEPYVPELGASYSNATIAIIVEIICTGILTALIEEFAFRGVLLTYLRKFGDVPAIVVSSLVFAVLHGNFVQIPYVFVLSSGLAFITIKTGSIYPAIFVHFVNNSIATLYSWVPDATTIFSFVIMVASVLSTYTLIKQNKLSLPKTQNYVLSNSKRTEILITSPFLLVYLIYEVITSLNFIK